MVDYSLMANGDPMDYCVYVHKNKINEKMYVGITNNTKARWSGNGRAYKRSTNFYNAIQKYGFDNFEHIVIIDNIPKSIALIIECELIEKYNLVEDGYNLSRGSWDSTAPRKLSPPVFQYTLEGEFVRKWKYATEAVAKYGEGVYDNLRGTVNKAKGYQWSYTYMDKMPPYETKYRHNYLPIYQYSIDGSFIKEWKTRYEALEKCGTTVTLCAEGNARTAYGYRWSYVKVDKLPPLPPIVINNPAPPRGHYSYQQTPRVYKYDLYGNFIKKYENVAAIDDSEGDKVNIYRQCKDKNYHIIHDMLWIYEDYANEDFIWSILNKYRETHYKIYQYNFKGEFIKTFLNYNEIEENGYDRKVVGNAVHGKILSAYGFQWRSEFDFPPGELKTNYSMPVIQKTLDGEIIKIFENANIASKELGGNSATHILEVCRGKRPRAFNSIWQFATREEYENYIATNNNVNNQEVI